jgi:hypothetical protein
MHPHRFLRFALADYLASDQVDFGEVADLMCRADLAKPVSAVLMGGGLAAHELRFTLEKSAPADQKRKWLLRDMDELPPRDWRWFAEWLDIDALAAFLDALPEALANRECPTQVALELLNDPDARVRALAQLHLLPSLNPEREAHVAARWQATLAAEAAASVVVALLLDPAGAAVPELTTTADIRKFGFELWAQARPETIDGIPAILDRLPQWQGDAIYAIPTLAERGINPTILWAMMDAQVAPAWHARIQRVASVARCREGVLGQYGLRIWPDDDRGSNFDHLMSGLKAEAEGRLNEWIAEMAEMLSLQPGARRRGR